MSMKARCVFGCLLVMAAALMLSGNSAMATSGGGGGGEGGSGVAAAASREADRALALFREGDYARAIKVMGAVLERLPEDRKGEGNYIIGSSHLRTGNYEAGQAFSLVALSKYYKGETMLWGDREKVRTLAATDLSYHASDKGDYEIIGRVEGIVSDDVKLDRVLVREPNGVLAGRTRLSSILSFYKARALKNAKKAQEALELLKTMAFDTGKIFVDGKVTGLSEAVEKLTAEVGAMTARFLFRAVLLPLRDSVLSLRL